MRQIHLSHQFVEFIPEQLEEGVLYISKRYGTAAHKCCCGCGEEVITPLNPTDWSLRMDGNFVTLHPSIGNWSFACRSHYWIRKSKVIWAGDMSQKQIERGRTIDRAAKREYFEAVNRKKALRSQLPPDEAYFQTESPGLFYELWLAIKRWWNS
ncbi:MAG: DUF6527 family protein [Halobacteriota archaeon]